jgi:hypothetical protein
MIIEDIIDTFYMFYNTKTVLVRALAPHTHRTDKKLDFTDLILSTWCSFCGCTASPPTRTTIRTVQGTTSLEREFFIDLMLDHESVWIYKNTRAKKSLKSYLSKKIVSTKWRIYKGILASPRLLRKELRAVASVRILIFALQLTEDL